MAIQFIVGAGLIAAKLLLAIEAGKKMSLNQYRKKAQEKFDEYRIDPTFSQPFLSSIDEKIKTDELTVDEYLKAYKEVLNDLTKNALGKCDDLKESFSGLTQKGANELVGIFRKLADSLEAYGKK